MLLAELRSADATLRLNTSVQAVEKTEDGFTLSVSGVATTCQSLIVATGGLSIPKMGATGWGYDLARKFGLRIVPTRPGLVPLTFEPSLLERLIPLAGVATEVRVACGKRRFDEAMLFTHRGISGPAILQISSYWAPGQEIALDLAPGEDLFETLRRAKAETGRQQAATVLARRLPKRLAQAIADAAGLTGNIADAPDKALRQAAEAVNAWRVRPAGSEGYRTAEVTVGGVDTRDLDSRTLMARAVPGLFFVGEVVDVTGWLGGYNFQWAWASGWSAGQVA
jgi:predicted Rossmann fold flavoprotein